MRIVISYQPFWDTLNKKGISQYKLNKYHNISQGTLYRIKNGKPMSTTTLDDLCKILQCRVEDILLFVDDSEE